ncbi:MAG: NAD(+)/NADH kinase [Lachnospiraceae bacterium]|nr:NAD(+)/NADH kinase [Lachnospiraceae bacterium]
MKKFVIYKNPYKDKDEVITGKVKKCLRDLGAEVTDFKDYKGDFSEDVMTIVLGGDGTMLQAIRDTHFMLGPVIGINLGTLGFLTEIEPDSYEKALTALVNDDFTTEQRLLLEGEVCGINVRALNDVVLTRNGGLRINSFNIYVNGLLLAEYFADGVIISTPTGSTGYNLSAGGPIASPASELIILTPICPHSLNHRSIILSCKDEIKIEIPASKDGGNQEMELSFDGSSKEILKTGDSVVIHSSESKVSFAKLGKDSFLDILNKKMSEK